MSQAQDDERIWTASSAADDGSRLYYTADGGTDWQEVELPAAVDGKKCQVIAFRERIAVRAFGDSDMYVPADDGESWRPVAVPKLSDSFVLANGRLVVIAEKPRAQVSAMISSEDSWTEFEPLELPRGADLDLVGGALRMWPAPDGYQSQPAPRGSWDGEHWIRIPDLGPAD